MSKIVIRTDDTGEFFARAKDAARRADQAQQFEEKVTLSFEDPQRMFTVLSATRRRGVGPKRYRACSNSAIARG